MELSQRETCDCLRIEEIMVIAGQLLPRNNEVTDEYEELVFYYCPVCGTELNTVDPDQAD